jgi:DNA-binding GntR family transcriptional regulator
MTLVERVIEDLRTRLESGDGPPCKLTFSSLSRHYEVSLTPVREAVRQLVSEGYLVKLGNGRLEVNDPLPKRKGAKRSPPPSLPANREAVIRADILRYLREDATAAKYGIGRTVLRPIFSRLAGQGLLEHVPRCGWRIHTFDSQDLGNFIQVRESLETRALQSAQSKLDKDVLQTFLDGNRAVKITQMGQLDNNLHSYWIKLSGNRYIIDFFSHQAMYYSTLFDFAAPEAHVVAEMAAQHCEILEALIDERWSDARKSLVAHIRAQEPIVQQLLAQVKSAGNSP